MSSWKQAVQAQLLFAHQTMTKAQNVGPSGGAVLQSKQHRNSTILCMRELWICWLNEWVELLTPKAKSGRFSSWREFEQAFSDFPSVHEIKEELKLPDSWAKGFIELEQLSAVDWLDIDERPSDEQNETLPFASDGLSLVQLETQPSSVLHGLQDISRMLTQLKLFIEQVREQHSEW
jgi:hypothetical protein